MEVTDGSGAAGYYKGNALVIDDSAYLEALENVEKNMRFLQAFYPLALLLMMAGGLIRKSLTVITIILTRPSWRRERHIL